MNSQYLKIIFCLFSLTILACKKDLIPTSEPIKIAGTTLTADKFKSKMNKDLLGGKSMVFVNDKKEEVLLQNTSSEKSYTLTNNNENYYSMVTRVSLINEAHKISIQGQIDSRYLGAENNISSVGYFFNFSPKYSFLTVLYDPNTDKLIDFFEPIRETIPTLTLLGRDFKNVVMWKNEKEATYNSIYFNQDYGIIGFTDEDNELYVFSRYE